MTHTRIGNITTTTFMDGTWRERTYNDNNVTFYQDMEMWVKVKYDKNNKVMKYEDSDGNYWTKDMNIPIPYVKTMGMVSNQHKWQE